MLNFLLLILLLTLFVTGLLVLMIKKYYWGRTGVRLSIAITALIERARLMTLNRLSKSD